MPAPKPPQPPVFPQMTIHDVCEMYSISHDTVQRYVRQGRLKGYRIGPRLVRFDPNEVAAALLKPIG